VVGKLLNQAIKLVTPSIPRLLRNGWESTNPKRTVSEQLAAPQALEKSGYNDSSRRADKIIGLTLQNRKTSRKKGSALWRTELQPPRGIAMVGAVRI
jgi:hypothetical protein